MQGNTVEEGGYGRDVATPAISFYATLYYEDGTIISLAQKEAHHIDKWKSGDSLPRLQISMYDTFGQGPARQTSRTVNFDLAELSYVWVPDYTSYVTAVMSSPDGLLSNDMIADLTSGEGNITAGPPFVKPGDYSAVTSIPDMPKNNSITLNVTIRQCVINEYPRRDRKQCIECEAGHYNFDPEKGICQVCPDNADCTEEFILPTSTYWNAFPCSQHVQRCLHEDACRGLDVSELERILTGNDAETCDFLEEEIESYQHAECKNGYQGALCGACEDDYAKVGLSRCRYCRNRFLIVIAIVFLGVLLMYSSWEQISSNLEHVKIRWLRRMETLRLGNTQNNIEEMMETAQSTHAYALEAQKAKREFVLVLQVSLPPPLPSEINRLLQIVLNFMQSISASLSLELAWSSCIIRLLEAWSREQCVL